MSTTDVQFCEVTLGYGDSFRLSWRDVVDVNVNLELTVLGGAFSSICDLTFFSVVKPARLYLGNEKTRPRRPGEFRKHE